MANFKFHDFRKVFHFQPIIPWEKTKIPFKNLTSQDYTFKNLTSQDYTL